MLPFLEIISDVEIRDRVEELYYEHRQLLFNIAKKYVHKDDLAEDAVQETFLAVAEKCETLNLSDDKEAKGLLSVIVRRRAIKIFNKGVRNEELIEKISLHESFEDDSPENDFFKEHKIKTVVKALNSLDEKYSDLLYLQVVCELKTKDIAHLLDKSDGAVRQLLHTARVKLREITEKEESINE